MIRSRFAGALLAVGLAAVACTGGTAAPTATGVAPTGAAPTGAAPTGATSDGPKSGTARLGRGGDSIAFVPTEMAIERLNEMGYDIQVTQFESTSTEIQAATEGAIDIASASAAAQMAAIDAGMPNQFFLTRYINEFVLVAKAEFATCESLDGQRVAIHAQTDITGLLTLSYFEQTCPDAEPNIQIVEGSENRLAGLLQDQLDASPLDLQNTQQLMQERTGEFVVVANFVEDFPLIAGVYSAPPEWLAANAELVKDFIAVHLDIWEEIYADPQILIDQSIERLPEVDPALIPPIVEEYLDKEIFPPDGDLQEERVQQTVDFFSEAGGFENVGSADDVTDRSYLEEVLAER